MKKRVVIMSAFLSPFRSGAEACAEEVALRLSNRFDVTIVTAKLHRSLLSMDILSPYPSAIGARGAGGACPPDRTVVRTGGVEVSHVQVIRIGLGRPVDKWLFPFLAPFAARKLKPDIVHAVLESFAGLALLFCKWVIPRAKRILTLQTMNRNFLRGLVIRRPHRVTAISVALQKQAARYGRTDLAVIPNGIPYAEIRKACEGTEKVPRRILFVGRLEKMKGVDVLLKALAISPLSMRDERGGRGGEVHIVGSGSQEAALKNLCNQLRLADRVSFLGRLDGHDLFREYAEAEVFCGLSRSEALGNVFLEAQAAGCAIVATNAGGIPEIVENGITGILTEPDDPAAAADALKRLLSNGALRNALASAAVTHAAAYGWDAIAKLYAQQYDTLLV